MFNGICPVCSSEIPTHRMVGQSAVCSCGWSDDKATERHSRLIEKRIKGAFLIFSVTFLSAYLYMHRWGSYAYSMPFLTVSQAIGTISPQGLETIIAACSAHGRWECVAETHLELFAKTRNPDVLARLASRQTRRGNEAEAIRLYAQWKTAGGASSKHAFDYAVLLERAGKKDEAVQMYAASASASQDRLPVRATSAVVRLLMEQQRYQEAYDWLINFHASAGNAADYLTAELETLEGLLKKSSAKKMAAR